jgi:hypothetical protein
MEAAGRRAFLCMALHIDERKRARLDRQTKLLAFFVAALTKVAEDHEEQRKLGELREYARS